MTGAPIGLSKIVQQNPPSHRCCPRERGYLEPGLSARTITSRPPRREARASVRPPIPSGPRPAVPLVVVKSPPRISPSAIPGCASGVPWGGTRAASSTCCPTPPKGAVCSNALFPGCEVVTRAHLSQGFRRRRPRLGWSRKIALAMRTISGASGFLIDSSRLSMCPSKSESGQGELSGSMKAKNKCPRSSLASTPKQVRSLFDEASSHRPTDIAKVTLWSG
jgi:hypothetical protein